MKIQNSRKDKEFGTKPEKADQSQNHTNQVLVRKKRKEIVTTVELVRVQRNPVEDVSL